MRGPCIGLGVQAMVDVHRAQAALAHIAGIAASACNNTVESRPPLSATTTALRGRDIGFDGWTEHGERAATDRLRRPAARQAASYAP